MQSPNTKLKLRTYWNNIQDLKKKKSKNDWLPKYDKLWVEINQEMIEIMGDGKRSIFYFFPNFNIFVRDLLSILLIY